MKNRVKKVAAALLAIAMLFSNIPAGAAYAAGTLGNDAAVSEQKEEKQEKQEKQGIEERLNYIYIENPYVETPDTQNIVVSWGDGTESIRDMRMTLQKEDGSTEEWECHTQSEALYLFSKEYTDTEEKSTYKALDIRFVEDGEEKRFSLEDAEVEAQFGVNQNYDGIEDLRPLSVEQAAETRMLETSVVTIDENGETKAEESIAEALEKAEAAMPAAAAAEGARTAERAGDIVVALDAGHDSRHGGAVANNLVEQDLTLKIANYAKAELESYQGVKVYMTRTTGACPYPSTSNSGKCIEQRIKAAAKAGAKIFVSIHLNSSPLSSANGSEIIIPNGSWKASHASQGKGLAEKILAELTAIGLNKRPTPIYSKDSTVSEYYPDGSKSDYFSAQIYGKENNVPAIIVEHAFMTNANDVSRFLKTEAGLKKIGVADATGIAKYFDLKKEGQSVKVQEGTYVLQTALNANKAAAVANDGMGANAALVLGTKKNSSSQRFEVESAGDGYYYIIAEHSGKALEVKGGSAAAGTAICQNKLNTASKAQKWSFVDAGNGYYYLRSALGTYADVFSGGTADGTAVWTYTFNGSSAQKWKLVKADYRPLKDGTYTVSSVVNNARGLDIQNASLADYGNVQLYNLNNTSSQRFEVSHVGNGYYKIIAENSGKALDVASASRANGANVHQYKWNGSDAQLWKFIDAGNGKYYIRSKLGTVLDLANKNAGLSSNVYAWEANGAKSQQWSVKESAYRPVKDGEYVISSAALNTKSMTEKNGNIQLETFQNSEQQKFKVTYVSGGFYKIVLRNTQNALDVQSASAAAGANLQKYTWNGSDAQLWKFIDAGNGKYYIRSKLGTVVDLKNGSTQSGNNIQMYTMNGTDAQKWELDSNKAAIVLRPFEDGTYTIKNSSNTQQVLDVSSAKLDNFANVQVYASNGTAAQRFELSYKGNGYYRITPEHSGKALDVVSASKKAGANVHQYTWNGSDAQLWKFIDAGNGKYYIQSKLGTVLDLNKTSAVSGANVQTGTMGSRSTQKWTLSKSEQRPVKDGEYVISSAAAKFKNLTEKDGNIQLETFQNSGKQKFKVTYVGGGFYKILLRGTEKSLDVHSASAAAGANLWQYTWNGSDAQLWKFIDAGNGSYYIRSKLGTTIDLKNGGVLSGNNVQLYTMNGTNAQKWVLDSKKVSMADRPFEDGTYTIKNGTNSSQVLDVTSASLNNVANIQVYASNNTSAQRFEVVYKGDGYYKIAAEHSGKSLDVANASKKAGTNVHQYAWNGSDAQLWKFIDAGNGKYYIQSKLGTVLDLNKTSAVSGANVQTGEMGDRNAQKWSLSEVTSRPVEDGLYHIKNVASENQILDIAAASTADKANVQLYDYNATEAQKFRVAYVGHGYYKITAEHSKKVLEADGSAAGANVRQNTWKNTENQLWKFVGLNNGTYYIKSKAGTTLSVQNGNAKAGANVQMAAMNGTLIEQWTFADEKSLLYKIMGTSEIKASQMAAFYKERAKVKYPYPDSDAPTIEAFCKIYVEECETEGVKAEVAFAQAMLETGFLKFGGDVKPDQYNFAGLGATGGVPGERFPSVRIGIRAHVQHLKAYASKEPLKLAQVDNRFQYVKRGTAEYVQWLGMQENPNSTSEQKVGWAAAKNYGFDIVKLYILPMKKL